MLTIQEARDKYNAYEQAIDDRIHKFVTRGALPWIAALFAARETAAEITDYLVPQDYVQECEEDYGW